MAASLQDYRLRTQAGCSRRQVTHLIDDPLLPPSAPSRLETWESKKQKFGDGGQGRVYLQECKSDGPRKGEVRALKVIRCQDDDGRNRYLRELEVMAKFSHQRYSKLFIRMLGYYMSSNGRDICIAMDYCSKGDLQMYLSNHGPISEQGTRYIIRQILQGLAMMHSEGFAHRDIKPRNILIHQHPISGDEGWWVKLADFGISKKINTDSTVAHVGTHDFMAPELLDGSASSGINYEAADMWAVGATALHLLTKHRGFQAWRRSPDSRLFGGIALSPEALAFILQVTSASPTDRLARDHSWFPDSGAPIDVDTSQVRYSSDSSLMSSFEETEIATLATRIEDTILSHPGVTAVTHLRQERVSGAISGADQSYRSPIPKQPLNETLSLHHVDYKVLFDAIDAGDIEAVRNVIKDKSSRHLWDHAVGDDGQTPVYAAAAKGHLDILMLLQEQGGDMMARNGLGETPLYAASRAGHTGVVEFLGAHGADINAKGGSLGNALHAASHQGHTQIVRMLLDKGANVNAKGSRFSNALEAASYKGQTQTVQILLDKGAEINAGGGFYGGNALHAASLQGRTQIVRMLLDKGADINAEGVWGNALYVASNTGHTQTVQMLLDKGANINAEVGFYGNALQAASSKGHTQIVQILLDKGADINTEGGIYGNALQVASYEGHTQIVQMLLDKGADVDARSGLYRSTVDAASKGNHKQIVQMLLDKGADVNT